MQLADLTQAWLRILSRVKHNQSHQVEHEAISVRERMSAILRQLNAQANCAFSQLFQPELGAAHVVVNFIALLELVKEGLVLVRQENQFGEIEIALTQSQTQNHRPAIT